jgi:predicted ATPase
VDAAIAQATTAITTMRTAYGSNLQCTRYLAWVVEACLEHGRVARAGALLNEALQLTGEDGERYWLAELLRLQARLRQAEGADPAEVERLLHEAIGVARDQHALTFEQRASAALERLMRDQGRQAEANAVAARPALRS